MDLETHRITHAPGVFEADVAESHVLLSPELAFHGLNRVGERIWQLLAVPTTVDAVVAALVDQFEVAPEQARAAVVDFIAELDERGLVTLS